MVNRPDPRRGEVYLVALGETHGHEIRKTRPALIVSPDEMHGQSRLVIIAPLTSGTRPAPFRVECRFQGKAGRVLLDHLRSVDRTRLIRPLGKLTPAVQRNVLEVLQEMFTP
ncbi:MAG: type II toxin-antitoxin system PemK/MazF family toxin [Gemmatimonadota bacterium]